MRSRSGATWVARALLVAAICAVASGQAAVSESRHADDATARLGALLFNDPRLSTDGRVSCATCHQPDRAFSDSRPRAEGVHGTPGTRNAPSLLDATDRTALFWDGRRGDLETLVLDPLLGPREHGLRNVSDIERRVADDRSLRRAYAEAFGTDEPVTATYVARSLAAYVSTLKTSPSAFDRYAFGKDSTALDPQQVFGYQLFAGRAGCSACHLIGTDAAPFTDDRFHDQGISADHRPSNLRMLVDRALAIDPANLGVTVQSDPEIAALGRFLVTRQPLDIGAFRTPSLRNVSLTSPYMHDGSIATLREAVKHELYYSARDRGANFSYEEQEALVAFLRSLTGEEQKR